MCNIEKRKGYKAKERGGEKRGREHRGGKVTEVGHVGVKGRVKRERNGGVKSTGKEEIN